jgi:predicted dehydrogenase
MNAKSKVSIAMVGCGGMPNAVHFPSLTSFDDVEIVAICDLVPNLLHERGDKFGIPRDRRFELRHPEQYREILQKVKPDGVYVIGQPHVMYDIWTWCLEQKLNLYIEKPMGITLHQARSLTHLAQQNGCITQVSHQRRTAPLLRKMRDACLERGPIVHGLVEFYKCAIEPFLGARDHMLDDCTHSVDTARWICGGEVTSVESQCKRIGVPNINWIGITIHFDNGSSCYVINSWASGRRIFRVEMHSPTIYADVDHEHKAYLYADGDYDGKVFDAFDVAGSKENYVFGGFQAKNREFIDSLKSGKEVTSSPFRDTLKTMEICETVLAQALFAGV